MKVMRKMLCCIVTLLVLLSCFPMTAMAVDGYAEVMAEIKVSGNGTFYLVEEGKTDILQKINVNGIGTFTLSYSEPGDYHYEIYSTDEMNSQRYSVLVMVLTDADTNTLFTNVTVYPQSSDRKCTIAYYPIVVQNPPIVKVIKGSSDPVSTVFEFEFTAAGTTAEGVTELPMPDGLKATQSKRFQIVGAGEVEVGNLYFSKPGVYKYEVREVPGNSTQYRYDSSVFQIEYDVIETDGGLFVSRVMSKNGQPLADDVMKFEFVNEYVNKGPIKTGDTYGLSMLLGIFTGSVVMVLFALIIMKRKEKDERI